MAEQEEEIMWPGGAAEAKSVEDFDYFMTGKDNEPITKVPKSRLAEVIGVVGESMPAIQGGATSAASVALPDGPIGQNRWFDASWGYWKYNNVVLKNPTGTDGIPQGNDGQLYWNGTATTPAWSISKMQALPTTPVAAEVIEGGTEATSQDAVFKSVKAVNDKVTSIAELSTDPIISNPVTIKPVSSSAANYGISAGLKGWGWPSLASQNVYEVNVKIVSNVGSNTQVLAIYENDVNGVELHKEAFSKTILGNSVGVIHNFQLNKVVKNTNNAKLWIEFYCENNIGIYRINPAVTFTIADGYPWPRSTTANDLGVTRVSGGSASAVFDIYHEIVTVDVTEEEILNFSEQAEQQIKSIAETVVAPSEISMPLPNENERITFILSSVTGAETYLQTGYVGEHIKWRQSVLAKAVLAFSFSNGVIENNRKHFLGQAIRITGVGSEIEFKLKGNEVSLIHSIDRTNTNASEIEVYIDGALYDTFNNYNPTPIGSHTKTFTGDGTAVMFDLGMAFTFGHSVTINGVSKVVTHNVNQNVNFTIPTGSDCAIIRKLGIGPDGKPAVTHWLWFKVAPTAGQNISTSFNNGAKLTYERTTIGENTAGVTECPYGDGDVSFDTTNPSSLGTGLDFRQTDDRCLKTYRFVEEKERTVKLKIKGLYTGSTGTPYLLFNFATNRFFHFQNAGIGGWDLWDFDKTINDEYLRGWQRVVQFSPDKLIFECTPNDDWFTRGHKLYRSKEVGLAELRTIKNMPLRSIDYNSGTDSYTFTRWKGTITAITETSVTFDGTVATPIVVGDMIMIGQFWANNSDYIERIVSSVSGNTLGFDKPISNREIIYNSLSDFVGKEITVRSYDIFKTKLNGVIDKIRSSSNCSIYLLENPMPDVLYRELWGYPLLFDQIANEREKVFHINYSSLRKWQLSQAKTSVNVVVTGATVDPYLNKKTVEFGTVGQNLIAVDILQNGISIYGKKAVVENGWAYTVNQTATGSALNKQSGGAVNTGQVYNGRKPRVVILDDALTGTVTVLYASNVWSADSTHINSNSAVLYSDFLKSI